MSIFLESIKRTEILVEALPYIQGFRGKTVVIKYGGSAMEDPELVEAVLRDIVFLEAVGINPVIVHGGGKAITRRMDEEGIHAQFAAGLRVTDAKTISVVQKVLDEQINPSIVKKIISMSGKAQSVSGKKVFRVTPSPPVKRNGEAVDLGFVGEVESCAVKIPSSLVRKEIVPVISPLGCDAKKRTFNINADIAAAEIAIALKAFKIIYLSDVNGILSDAKDEESTISTVDAKHIEEFKRQGVVSGGMLPKVDSGLKALRSGVEKVHLIDGRIPHSLLLELFTDHGIGTEIVK